MNGLTVLGQKADRNLQIQICNQIQIASAIPVLPTQTIKHSLETSQPASLEFSFNLSIV